MTPTTGTMTAQGPRTATTATTVTTAKRANTLALALAALVLASACGRSESRSESKAPAGSAAPGTATEPAGSSQAGQTGQATAKKTAVTLQLNWVPEPEFGGFYAAAHQGLYEKEGLDVTIAAGAAGVQTWSMVATGKVPFGIVAADEVLRARLKDADIVAVYAAHQTNPHALMVHEQSGVTSLEEIFTSGKITRVAMEAGLPYGRHLKNKYGFDKVDVIQYSGNLTLFFQDPKMAQQCYVFAEPVSAKENNVAVKAFSLAESGFNPYMTVVVTSGAYLEDNPDVVARFVRATRAGWSAYLADPEPTNQYMKEQKGAMSLPAMKLAAELQKPYIVTDEVEQHYLGYMTEARWRTLAEQLQALGEIDRIPDIAACFRNIE